jgi:hypothetical protein
LRILWFAVEVFGLMDLPFVSLSIYLIISFGKHLSKRVITSNSGAKAGVSILESLLNLGMPPFTRPTALYLMRNY